MRTTYSCDCVASTSSFSRSDHADSGGAECQGTFSAHFGAKQGYDLILQSCDDVLFGVHKTRLAGSSVFGDMFSLGDCYRIARGQHRGYLPAPETETLTLAESASTLEGILPFLYDDFVDVDSLPFDSVIAAFEASAKYGMSLPEHIYTARLRRMLKTDACTAEEAFELWRLCRVLDRPELASLALQHTAKGNILQFRTTHIHSLTPRDVDHIWRIHLKQEQIRADMLFDYAWRAARGKCFFFSADSHCAYMRQLVLSKCNGAKCNLAVPAGFTTCDKCSRMAEELQLSF